MQMLAFGFSSFLSFLCLFVFIFVLLFCVFINVVNINSIIFKRSYIIDRSNKNLLSGHSYMKLLEYATYLIFLNNLFQRVACLITKLANHVRCPAVSACV